MTSSTESALTGRRVVVTGANGFIGAHVVNALLLAGADVVPVVRPSTEPWRLEALAPDVPILRADVRALDEGETVQRVRSADLVLHLAAAGVLPGMHDVRELVDHNVAGTLATMRFAERVRARRVVCCGSCFEYGNVSRAAETLPLRPLSEYGATKAASTTLAQAIGRRIGMAVVVLRPFTVYGPLEDTRRLVPYVMARALAGLDIELTSGRQTRDWLFIDDAVDAFLLAATAPDVAGETFNVCTGVEIPVREVVEQIVEQTGGTGRPRFGARADREPEHWTLSGDPAHATERLGFTARVSLAVGLARTLSHMPLPLVPPRAAVGGLR